MNLIDMLPEDRRELLDRIRKSILSIAPDIVEDIRMHRVIFGRRAVLRTFLDLQPEKDGFRISFPRQKRSLENLIVGRDYVEVKSADEIDLILPRIREAYESV